jgi:hypothetical protein
MGPKKTARVPNMSPSRFRRSEDIRRGCAHKLRSIEKSGTFTAILGSLLDEDWTTPNIVDLRIYRNRHLVGRISGESRFKAFHGAKAGLIRNIHGIAAEAGLDGDELSYLLGKVAEIKTANWT